ncbi:type VI secretion system lipoprotein TssJ [Scandinavium goeteborgense]|jgi:type VI secretion system protein VasD|uniref:type VI secretion system lipoprotein TssJ n=1 Tax=Scandinavium goeteborgense TaxID=1851514 RepID=UPI000D7C9ED4|nr:type VI secretion system lipoprotein TssJ [Scandinavium goeteborgense]MCS2154617.1 type VI secretion system lipoprotein TssJ [Scandinavium goeteborgense]
MIKHTRNYRLLSVLCLAFLLTGCSAWKATKKVGEVIMDPDVPVGVPAEQPSTVRMVLLAEPDTNPNTEGEATPVEFAVIYLSEDSKLLAADHDQLTPDTLEKTLGKNYLDHQEYTLLADQYKALAPITLEEKTRYIGVVAWFADAEHSEWKKTIKIKSIGQHYQILIHLRANEIELRKEEE